LIKQSSERLPDTTFLSAASTVSELSTFWALVTCHSETAFSNQGVIGYSLLARSLKGEFWTLSAWSDGSTLHDFVRTSTHVRAMSALRWHMGQTVNGRWLARICHRYGMML